MSETTYFEVFPTFRNINKMRKILVEKHHFEEKENINGPYFFIEVPNQESWMIKTILDTRKYKYRTYSSRYARSTNYRKAFFDTHKGPYRCAYCGKRVEKGELEVDHLIPVSKAKSSYIVRMWLHMFGITNINNPRNLVPACRKCNRRKSDHMGWWVVRGLLGKNKGFWVARNVIAITCIACAIYVLCVTFPIFDVIGSRFA